MCNAWNHPAGCDCGWGGNGWPHWGTWQAGTIHRSLPQVTHVSRTLRSYSYGRSDVCYPTKCPECGEEVYFVRHNDGSVWLDELGWPWPKHRHCNEDWSRIGSFYLRAARIRSGVEAPPVLGRIAKEVYRSFDIIYLVTTEDGRLVALSSSRKPHKIPHGIVIIRFTEDGLLLEDESHDPVHVKDARIDAQVLHEYLEAPGHSIRVGWQPK